MVALPTVSNRRHPVGYLIARPYDTVEVCAAALVDGQLDPAAAGALLADLHSRLHALPARHPDRPDARILPLDLHPGNVILTPRGPMVIDWRNATDGPPDLDLAVTALILAEVAAGSFLPAELPGHVNTLPLR